MPPDGPGGKNHPGRGRIQLHLRRSALPVRPPTASAVLAGLAGLTASAGGAGRAGRAGRTGGGAQRLPDPLRALDRHRRSVLSSGKGHAWHQGAWGRWGRRWGRCRPSHHIRRGVEFPSARMYVRRAILVCLPGLPIIVYPVYTFITIDTPMYTRYTCVYNHIYAYIYTFNTPLNAL